MVLLRYTVVVLALSLIVETVHSQSFLHFYSFGVNRAAAGLEDNHHLLLKYKLHEKAGAVFHQSLYVDDLKDQLFQLDLYGNLASFNLFSNKTLDLSAGIAVSGNYNSGPLFYSIYADQEFHLYRWLVLANTAILYYGNSDIRFHEQAGILINVYREVSLFSSYGWDELLYRSERNLDAGLFFRDIRTTVKLYAELPDNNPDLKYTRLMVSFLYTFNL